MHLSGQGCEQDYEVYRDLGRDINDAGESLTPEVVGFVEAVQASNRREAMILARRKYPGYNVGSRVARVFGALLPSRNNDSLVHPSPADVSPRSVAASSAKAGGQVLPDGGPTPDPRP